MEPVVVRTLVLVLTIVVVSAYAGIAGHTRRAVTCSQSALSTSPAIVVSRDAAPDRDLDYGSEVTHAVAEYSLDPDGLLYEVHAPQVELPHLGSPKS